MIHNSNIFCSNLNLNAIKPESYSCGLFFCFTLIMFIYYCQTLRLVSLHLLSVCGSVIREENHNCPTHAEAHSWPSSDETHIWTDEGGLLTKRDAQRKRSKTLVSISDTARHLQSLEVNREVSRPTTHLPFRHRPETKQHQDNLLACLYVFIAFKVRRARQ